MVIEAATSSSTYRVGRWLSLVSLGYACYGGESTARSKQDGHGTLKRRNSLCGIQPEDTRARLLSDRKHNYVWPRALRMVAAAQYFEVHDVHLQDNTCCT